MAHLEDQQAKKPKRFWNAQRIDEAAFGIIYGSIMALSLLMAIGDKPDAPFETAAVLFGSLLAITMAKTFAEFMSQALATGEHLTRPSWRDAWSHSASVLAVANTPTLLFLLAGIGLLSADFALVASQAYCVLLLTILGARVGWVLEGKATSAVLGACFSGGFGLLLAFMKYFIH